MTTDWIEADWPAPAGIIAGTTTRRGGVSAGAYHSMNLGAHVADEPDRVAENRRRFVADLGLGVEPDWLTQVHGTRRMRQSRGGRAPPRRC
jgi:copper oxidase (laccase) domain-containing protein